MIAIYRMRPYLNDYKLCYYINSFYSSNSLCLWQSELILSERVKETKWRCPIFSQLAKCAILVHTMESAHTSLSLYRSNICFSFVFPFWVVYRATFVNCYNTRHNKKHSTNTYTYTYSYMCVCHCDVLCVTWLSSNISLRFSWYSETDASRYTNQ